MIKVALVFMSLAIVAGAREASLPKVMQIPTYTSKQRLGKPAVRRISGQQIRIGIIDTGYAAGFGSITLKICESGHFDFMTGTKDVGFASPHGSIVGSIIAESLEDVNYCAVIFQVVGPDGRLRAEIVRQAFERAKREGLSAVNLSISGQDYNFRERSAISALASRGTTIFAAAGNERTDLDKFCNALPACYPIDNMYVVGATERDNSFPAPYSNYGQRVHIWAPGDYEVRGQVVEGTSFAAPRALSEYVRSLSDIQNRR